ncbi:MAG: hypothetical protein L6V85_06455 [Clostridiales bacterium]|nr:MAG: hypothetical protein L6V85_06455 [Clostridiales bacterium]
MPDITEITTTVIIDGRKPSAPFNIREKISPMKSLKDTPTLPSISLFQKFLETARDKRAFVVGKRRIIIFQAFKVKFFSRTSSVPSSTDFFLLRPAWRTQRFFIPTN